jgi:hypothetical protein
MTLARNGGSELAVRSLVLGDIERETRSLALTESDGQRCDTNLRCLRCGELLAVIEFKHNLLSQGAGLIWREELDAVMKLHRAATEPVKLYVHFVFGLPLAAHSRICERHNAVPRLTRYKRFVEEAQLRSISEEVCRGREVMEYPINPPTKDSSSAYLLCWHAVLK